MAYRSMSHSGRPHTIIAMALVGTLWAGFWILPTRAFAAGFTLMSESGEIETGKKLDDEIGNKMGFYTEPKLQVYVSEVVRRLVRAGSPRSFEYRVKIVDIPEENAFATVGGFVYITRGMLAELQSETELAGVLAHEISHISHRHVAKQQTRALGYQILGLGAMALGATMGNADNNLGAAPLGISAALATIMSSYSQEAELEADESGLLMMAQAGYDPRGLVTFLRGLRARERLTGLGYHGLLASHPQTAERIAKSEIMAQLLASQQSASDPGEDSYKTHLIGLPFGERHDRRRLALYRVEPEDTIVSIRQKVMSPDEKAWEVTRLNRLRSNDSLRTGMLLKIVVPDDRPIALPQRRLDISQERPVPPPPPPPVMPPRRTRVPYPRN
ncbi:MAG: M48 family metalloprotease [Candidatus Entotheonellia bacterium]